jgi:VWFA-related protein
VQRFVKLPILLVIFSSALCHSTAAQSKPKLPKAIDLTKSTNIVRDPSTGELAAQTSLPTPGKIAATISVATKFLLVPCSATSSDETPIRSLRASDFQLKLDGAPQQIAHLDVSETFANIALVLDASPSEGHAIGDMKAAARSLTASLAPADQVAVVAFAGHAHLLLPFSTDRALLESALKRIDLLRGEMEIGSNVYSAIYLTAQRLFVQSAPTPGRNAIIVLTDGQDSELSLSWDPASMQAGTAANPLSFEDVAKTLSARGIQLFIISTENRPKPMTPGWLSAHANAPLIAADVHRLQIPTYTIFLAELVRQAGGSLYFLHEIGALADVYRRIAMTLHAEYVLAASLDGEVAHPGWHRVNVALRDPAAHSDAKLNCRQSYYVPNSAAASAQQ